MNKGRGGQRETTNPFSCFEITFAQFSRTSLNRANVLRFIVPISRNIAREGEKIDDESDPAPRFSVPETQTEV